MQGIFYLLRECTSHTFISQLSLVVEGEVNLNDPKNIQSEVRLSAGFLAIAGGLKSFSNTDQFVHHLNALNLTSRPSLLL